MIELPPLTAYYPKYLGCLVTEDASLASIWRARGPDPASLTRYSIKDNGTKNEIKHPRRLWVWVPPPPENEFGPVSP